MATLEWQLRNNGGFTVGLSVDNPAVGYAVGGVGWTHIVDKYDLRPEAVNGWLERLREVAYLEGYDYLGAWEANGRWFVEPVSVVDTERQANLLARGRDQVAFHDLIAGEDIVTD